jgi:hypothetical protein
LQRTDEEVREIVSTYFSDEETYLKQLRISEEDRINPL